MPSLPADPFALSRFLEAQAPVYRGVCAELAAGAKRSHWMWFVFPQLRPLGRSATAQFFGLSGRQEAAAYLLHPVLGTRLRECCDLLLALRVPDAATVFGAPDDLKLRSCMTLFEAVADAAPDATRFAAVLDRSCSGQRDAETLRLLQLP